MNKIVRNLGFLSLVGGSSVFAAPFLAIGDNAELFLTANAEAAYSDNILLSQKGNELEDTTFTFIPGFDLQYGKNSQFSANLKAFSTLSSYADNSYLNNQLFGTLATATYDNGRVKLNANAGFREIDQPTVDVIPSVGRLLERHVTTAGLDAEVSASEKISFGTGVDYSKSDFKSVGVVEDEQYQVPVNVYYELTPKVDISAGLSYRHTELTGVTAPNATEYDDVYYNVGARGEFTPKLSGKFSVGFNTRDANRGEDEDGSLGARASLDYAYSEKTQLNLAFGREFTNSTSGGASYENTSITLGAGSFITTDWRLNASATYRMLDYAGFTEDYIEGTVGASYFINQALQADLAYTFRQKTSDRGAASEFANNVVTLSVSARY